MNNIDCAILNNFRNSALAIDIVTKIHLCWSPRSGGGNLLTKYTEESSLPIRCSFQVSNLIPNRDTEKPLIFSKK